MVDLGAVGVTPDPAEWASGTDYSHASKAFADVILPTAPYVDQAALAKAYTDYDTFLRHSLANGYTAVAFPGFIEFVTLQGAPGRPGLRRGRRARRAGAGDAQGLHPVLGPRPGARDEGRPAHRHAHPHHPPRGVPHRARRLARHDRPRPLGRLHRRARRALRRRAVARRGARADRRGRTGLRRRRLGLLLLARRHHPGCRARHAHRPHRPGRAHRPRRHLPLVERGRGGRGRHAHQPAVVRGGARRHRLAGAGRLDEVHPRRLLQPPAAQRDPAVRQPAADRRVPEPSRVRELRRVPQRPRCGVPRRPATAARRQPADRGSVGVDPGRRPVARRPDDALPQDRLLAALRAEHLAGGVARA